MCFFGLGVVLSVMWFFWNKSTKSLARTIRSRLPDNQPAKQLVIEETEVVEIESSEEVDETE